MSNLLFLMETRKLNSEYGVIVNSGDFFPYYNNNHLLRYALDHCLLIWLNDVDCTNMVQ